MTIEKMRKALIDFCERSSMCSECELYKMSPDHLCGRSHYFDIPPNTEGYMSDDEIQRHFAHAFPEAATSTIKDSGERREFESGAVRDIQEGKGRCDLMPLDVVADHMRSPILEQIAGFMRLNEPKFLWNAMDLFQYEAFPMGLVDTKQRMANTLLEVAKHFEEGAKKYGEYNWQKGIPVKCYIDSAVRHYLKWLRGDKDEPHDRAFCWNIMCAIWTCKHKPELNDYRKDNTDAED